MPSVLVVDDRSSILDVLKMFLELQGYTVSTCGNGEEVLGLVRNQMPDVILLDLILPGKSGSEIIQELQTDPELTEIPVIAMTARNEIANEVATRVFACIMKPFDINDVQVLIEKALEARNSPSKIKQKECK